MWWLIIWSLEWGCSVKHVAQMDVYVHVLLSRYIHIIDMFYRIEGVGVCRALEMMRTVGFDLRVMCVYSLTCKGRRRII
jgi:hypothetical protein